MSLSAFYKLRKLSFIVITVAGASCISLIGGLGFEAIQNKALPLIPLILVLPGLNTMVGDYAATIAAHAGDPAEKKGTKKLLAKAIFKAVWVNIIGLTALSLVIATKRGYVLEQAFVIKFVLFVAFSMLAVIGFMLLVTYLLDRLLEKNRLNPDDVLIPVVTSITDVLMLSLVALSVWLIF